MKEKDTDELSIDKVKKWISDHRKELILAGMITTAIAVVALVYHSHKSASEIIPELEKMVETVPKVPNVTSEIREDLHEELIEKATKTITPHDRSEFIRNLHEGWKASPIKQAEALEKGIILGPGQTIVNATYVGKKIA